jgi:MprA protease rhombosortase-interaction domain-containing protein
MRAAVTALLLALTLATAESARADDCLDAGADAAACDAGAEVEPLHRIYRHGGCGCDAAGEPTVGGVLVLAAGYLGYGRRRRIVIAR